jgi:uncharacterized protein (DUF983 family)
MNEWICPHCREKMYSAYEQPKDKEIKCINCGKEFENPYYNETSIN